MSFISQFFLNPAIAVPGAALVIVPILIHILSRLRYKKVRFAAMEFLLKSEELNRRRTVEIIGAGKCHEIVVVDHAVEERGGWQLLLVPGNTSWRPR